MNILKRFKRLVQRKLGIRQLIMEQQRIAERQNHSIACQQEILKANLLRDTICDSEWLKYKSFSPGGWAVDYGLLYTLYRVLNDMKPKNVIEFGLGQSSKMIHQYGAFYKDSKVLTCEHNEEWIKFFQAEANGNYPMNIKLLELEKRLWEGYETLVYKGLNETCEDKKYDLVLVDGPFGSEHFSRSQLIDLAQDHLAHRFCIIMDDYERQGEQDTIEAVKKVLEAKQILYCTAVYEASKKHCLICSKDLDFLTTLYWF